MKLGIIMSPHRFKSIGRFKLKTTRCLVVLVALSVIGAVLLSSCGRAETNIVFVSERNGNAEVYMMNADGSDQVRLTADLYDDSDPMWSPDGMRVAFLSLVSGKTILKIMDRDGSNVMMPDLGAGSTSQKCLITFAAIQPLIIYVNNVNYIRCKVINNLIKNHCEKKNSYSWCFRIFGNRTLQNIFRRKLEKQNCGNRQQICLRKS